MMQIYVDAINASAHKPQYVFQHSLYMMRTESPERAIHFLKDNSTLCAVCKNGVMTTQHTIFNVSGCKAVSEAILNILPKPLPLSVDDILRIDIKTEEKFDLPLIRSTEKQTMVCLIPSNFTAREAHYIKLDEHEAEGIARICYMFASNFSHGEADLLAELESEVAHQ